MVPALPPLSMLRAFEAAARLGSFTKAAAELAVTQAAVSYQIKSLEARLGLVLFNRVGRKIELTPAGERLAQQASEAFGLLRTAVDAASDLAQRKLQITALPTVAANWLVPRLGDFHDRYPDYSVRVDASAAVEDLRTSQFDVAIRLGGGRWAGCHAVRLLSGDYTAVCSPITKETLRSPQDLRNVRLFGPSRWWTNWFRAAGLVDIEVAATDLATQSSEATAAVAQGATAIVQPTFFARELESGLLVRPFPISATSGSDYWLVHGIGADRQSKVRDFKQWLIAQCAAVSRSAYRRSPTTVDHTDLPRQGLPAIA